jgi:hypothetical protein
MDAPFSGPPWWLCTVWPVPGVSINCSAQSPKRLS